MKKFEFKGLKFLVLIAFIYMGLLVLDSDNALLALSKMSQMLFKLLPIFIFIILLTACINYFLNPKQIIKHFGKDSGKKGIFYAVLGGIFSHGPMYAWYGMLQDMRNHGLKDGLLTTFIYSRAVKLPMLPFMLELFGMTFTIVINIYIIIFAILQGKIIDRLMRKNEY